VPPFKAEENFKLGHYLENISGNNKHSVVVKSITRRPLLLPQILLRQHVCSTIGLRSFLLHELSRLGGVVGRWVPIVGEALLIKSGVDFLNCVSANGDGF
jgi:hypothetical protein